MRKNESIELPKVCDQSLGAAGRVERGSDDVGQEEENPDRAAKFGPQSPADHEVDSATYKSNSAISLFCTHTVESLPFCLLTLNCSVGRDRADRGDCEHQDRVGQKKDSDGKENTGVPYNIPDSFSHSSTFGKFIMIFSPTI